MTYHNTPIEVYSYPPMRAFWEAGLKQWLRQGRVGPSAQVTVYSRAKQEKKLQGIYITGGEETFRLGDIETRRH